MAKTSNAQKEATKRYLKDKTESIQIRVPKGQRTRIQARAASVGKSMRAYILGLIEDDIQSSETNSD